ncbi:hypothetical protein BJ878DRAFT_565331 [Calycina marina]|uniref:2EXR domain-containing protein n=1 Tax=Calycina marina TaxID=1763456 RepID=A0A9P7Z7C3_9HELO|nr:hypothetical protein BJ878DRAFT_565331 [Calycina marina]
MISSGVYESRQLRGVNHICQAFSPITHNNTAQPIASKSQKLSLVSLTIFFQQTPAEFQILVRHLSAPDTTVILFDAAVKMKSDESREDGPQSSMLKMNLDERCEDASLNFELKIDSDERRGDSRKSSRLKPAPMVLTIYNPAHWSIMKNPSVYLPDGSIQDISMQDRVYPTMKIRWCQPRLKSFIKFSEMPPEICCNIWVHALPAPRVVQVILEKHSSKTLELAPCKVFDQTAISLLLTCRESNGVFLKHYQKLKLWKKVTSPLTDDADKGEDDVQVGLFSARYYDPLKDTVFISVGVMDWLIRYSDCWLDLTGVTSIGFPRIRPGRLGPIHLDSRFQEELKKVCEYVRRCPDLEKITFMTGTEERCTNGILEFPVATPCNAFLKLTPTLSDATVLKHGHTIVSHRLQLEAMNFYTALTRGHPVKPAASESERYTQLLNQRLQQSEQAINTLRDALKRMKLQRTEKLEINSVLLCRVEVKHGTQQVYLLPKKPEHSGLAYVTEMPRTVKTIAVEDLSSVYSDGPGLQVIRWNEDAQLARDDGNRRTL